MCNSRKVRSSDSATLAFLSIPDSLEKKPRRQLPQLKSYGSFGSESESCTSVTTCTTSSADESSIVSGVLEGLRREHARVQDRLVGIKKQGEKDRQDTSTGRRFAIPFLSQPSVRRHNQSKCSTPFVSQPSLHRRDKSCKRTSSRSYDYDGLLHRLLMVEDQLENKTKECELLRAQLRSQKEEVSISQEEDELEYLNDKDTLPVSLSPLTIFGRSPLSLLSRPVHKGIALYQYSFGWAVANNNPDDTSASTQPNSLSAH